MKLVRLYKPGTPIDQLQTLSNVTLQCACPDVMDMPILDHFKLKGYRSKNSFVLPIIDDIISDLTAYNVSSITLQNLKTYKIDAVDGSGGSPFIQKNQIYRL